jgi:hypothetical protein
MLGARLVPGFLFVIVSKTDVTAAAEKFVEKNRAAGKLDPLFMIFPLQQSFLAFCLLTTNASATSSLKFLLFSLVFLFSFHQHSSTTTHAFHPVRHVDYSNLVSQNTSNDYKGAVYQNETNISSPARRSEVSPIQNHVSILGSSWCGSGILCFARWN